MSRRTRRQQEVAPGPVSPEEQRARLEHMAAFFRDQVAQVEPAAFGALVKNLRELADRVERTADLSGRDAEWRRRNGQAPEPFEEKVARVQHDVLWGLANLGLDRLVTEVKRQREYLGAARRAEAEATAITEAEAAQEG